MSDANDESVVDDEWASDEDEDDSSGAEGEGEVDGAEAGGDRDDDTRSELAPGAGRGRSRRGARPAGDAYEGDERAKAALQFVADVVREMEMDCRVHLRRPEQNDDDENPEVVIEISGADSGRIIGKKGQVLQALQFLTHRAINRPGIDRRHVLVDAEGYRSRRDNSLATMAKRLGKQAMDEGKIITFEPMNPRDRRVVHLALAKFEGVITKSDGEGDDRRVQIIPVRR
jgi:spoIIIJ-associated protein